METILIPVIAVTVIGILCGVGLSVASALMGVKETDERFPKIRECLPGANCGACGFSGCDGYARALLEPGTKTNLCIPGGNEAAKKISAVLGVEAEELTKKTAFVRCNGDCDSTSKKNDYYGGVMSCSAAKLYFGGTGSCMYGCLGLGDCQRVCPHNAIYVINGVARIDRSTCVGCGICAATCPQKLIDLIPEPRRIGYMVACTNKDRGGVTRKNCSHGCIGCKKCEKNCQYGAITVTSNLAYIDQTKCHSCGQCIDGCPTGAIHFFFPSNYVTRIH